MRSLPHATRDEDSALPMGVVVKLPVGVSVLPPQEELTPAQIATRKAAVANGAAQLARHRHLLASRMADAIESNPSKALEIGRKNLELWKRRRPHGHTFAKEWSNLLATWSLEAICTLLRDTTDATEQLRISAPFAGMLDTEQLRACSREAYR